MPRFTRGFGFASRPIGAVAVCAALVGLVSAGVVSAPEAIAEDPALLSRTVSYEGKNLTLRLSPVPVHASKFEVLVQQEDGSLAPYTAPAERAYLGSVDEDSGARASGIIDSEGIFQGTVVFDRGGTWFVRDDTVTRTRGLEQPTFRWPSSEDATRNVSTAPDQVGTTSYGWTLGYDVDNDWFTSAPVNGSVEKALDYIDLAAVSLLDVYESNALLRPSLGRVIIRASPTQDPYVGKDTGQRLVAVRTAWSAGHRDADVDDVALLHGSGEGGLGYVGTAGSMDWGYTVSDSPGSSYVVQRHEFAHTWSVRDNHTNGPEGATIVSGNSYDRFDGTELSAIMRYRDKNLGKFTNIGRFNPALPPYAALDMVDDLTATVPYPFNPVANDHDANADALSLQSVTTTSALGGTLTRAGDTVTYTPPKVTSPQTLDWAQYVVQDSTGKTATGTMLFRINPTAAPEPSATADPSATATSEPSATADPSATATSEPSATADPSATATSEPSATADPSATATPEPSATADRLAVTGAGESGALVMAGFLLVVGLALAHGGRTRSRRKHH
ncbi:Ig-like domain-containing protein [Paenarthrobacter sp. NPDC056912]|uniref:Ig-like domain-containing protein n=1 Tax=Paenarthrobacter sp. NPDC056912 TaxID=3345965 RepID=UPI00366E6738